MRSILKKLISIVSVLVLSVSTLVGCGASEDKEFLKMPNDKPGLLYKVKDTEVYLFGTQHEANKSSFPLNESIETSLKSSDIFASEQGSDLGNFHLDFNMYKYEEGDNIYNHVSEDGKEIIKNTIDNLKVDEVYLEYTPFIFNAIAIENYKKEKKIKNTTSLDQYLTEMAKENNKEIISLEGGEFQADLMKKFSDFDLEILMIDDLKNLDLSYDSLNEGIKALGEGNEKFFEEYRKDAKNLLSEEGYNMFLFNRDKNMTEKIEDYIKNKDKVFVAVGVVHLVGEDSVVGQLRSKGYEVEKVIN